MSDQQIYGMCRGRAGKVSPLSTDQPSFDIYVHFLNFATLPSILTKYMQSSYSIFINIIR